jgi:hypothetical protein
MTNYTLDNVQAKELCDRATARIALALATEPGESAHAIESVMRARGGARYVTKSDVTAITTGDTAVALMPLNAALLREIAGRTIDGQLDGALRLGLTAVSRLVVGVIAASEAAEAATKPIAQVTFADGTGTIRKAAGQIVVSTEAAKALGAETQALIAQHLIGEVSKARDRRFVTDLLAAGTSVADATPGAVLAAVSSGAPARPYIVGGLADLLALTPGLLRELRDLNVGVIPSPAAAGYLFAIDATGILIREGDVELARATNATVLLDDGSSPAGSTVVSLFQRNLTAVRAEQFMRYTIRPEAVAFAATGSPA